MRYNCYYTTTTVSDITTSSAAAADDDEYFQVVSVVKQISTGFPEGTQREMVKMCEDDVEYGERFLSGPNPVVIKR